MAEAAEPQGSLLTGFGSAWEGQDRGPTSLLWLCRGQKTQHNCAVKTEKSFLEDDQETRLCARTLKYKVCTLY